MITGLLYIGTPIPMPIPVLSGCGGAVEASPFTQGCLFVAAMCVIFALVMVLVGMLLIERGKELSAKWMVFPLFGAILCIMIALLSSLF